MNELPLLFVNHFVNKLNIVSTEIFFIAGFFFFVPSLIGRFLSNTCKDYRVPQYIHSKDLLVDL